MNLFKPVAVMLFVIAMLPAVWGISYDVLVQESGNVVVIASIEGSGLNTLELPMDAVPEVRGALYLKEDNIITLSIGSTEKAIVAYQTNTYTTREDSWKLNLDLDGPVKLIFPKSAEIISVTPSTLIEESDVKTIQFENASNIEVIYSVEDVDLTGTNQSKFEQIVAYVFFAAISLILISGIFLAYRKAKN